MRNHFGSESVAARYALGRPEFHAIVIDRLRRRLEPSRLTTALDAGCGTGASTRPLTRLARRAVGLDPSLAMLAHAAPSPQSDYVAGGAEELPFRTGSFDLLTVSSAFHWLDRDRFLVEALRVLRREGLLVVYDNFLTGEMDDGADKGDIAQWMRSVYWKRYPYPPRAPVEFELGERVAPGFQCETHDEYRNRMEFTKGELIDYLVTQTNVIGAVEEGVEDIEEVRRWLSRELALFFHDRRARSFVFDGPIWVLRPEYGT